MDRSRGQVIELRRALGGSNSVLHDHHRKHSNLHAFFEDLAEVADFRVSNAPSHRGFGLQQRREWYAVEEAFEVKAYGAPNRTQPTVGHVNATVFIAGKALTEIDRREHSSQRPQSFSQADLFRRA
jgi:hypothetical protein